MREQLRCEGCQRLSWVDWPACRVARYCHSCASLAARVRRGDPEAARVVTERKGLRWLRKSQQCVRSVKSS